MDGQQTRETILEKGVRLVSLHGLEQLTLGQLADEVGMSKSGLFAHFESKETLQLAVVDHGWSLFEQHVHRTGGNGRPEGGVEGLFERWLGFYCSGILPGGCFFVTAAVEFAAGEGPVRDALSACIRDEHELLEQAVAHDQRDGELDPAQDPEQLAFELHSILLNTNALLHVSREDRVLEQARTAFRRVVGREEAAAGSR